MKNNEATIFIFIASIITGFLIASNMSFNSSSKLVFLNFNQYQDAYNEKNKLTREVLLLNEQYRELSEKLNTFTEGSNAQSEHITAFQSELNGYKIINSLTKVQGTGLEIVLDDYEGLSIENYSPSDNVHDTDLLNIINDLRASGAEAISLNGHRIKYNSEIYCYGPDILVNGVSIPAPFTIDVIGDVDKINAFINSDESTIGYMMHYRKRIKVKIETKNNMIISAYDSNLYSKYLTLKK